MKWYGLCKLLRKERDQDKSKRFLSQLLLMNGEALEGFLVCIFLNLLTKRSVRRKLRVSVKKNSVFILRKIHVVHQEAVETNS